MQSFALRHTFSRLDHVQLAIPRGGENRARDFYVEILGFEEVTKPEELANRGGAWFQSGDVALHIGVDESFTPATKAHPALRCDEYAALVARLHTYGIAVTPDPLPFNGRPHCYIADPFGNRLEVIGPCATSLVPATANDFAAMLRGDASVRDGLIQPPGGVNTPDVIAHVAGLAANLHRCGSVDGHWMMVAEGEVVGLCGFKAPPSSVGEAELGYGVATSRRRRGHASAAVRAVVEMSRRDPRVRTITALTAISNIASQRVLERNEFERVGTRPDPDDGQVFVWQKRL